MDSIICIPDLKDGEVRDMSDDNAKDGGTEPMLRLPSKSMLSNAKVPKAVGTSRTSDLNLPKEKDPLKIRENILETMSDGILVVSGNSHISYWNAAAQGMLNLSGSPIASSRLSDLDSRSGKTLFENLLTEAVQNDASSGEYSVRHRLGKPMWLSVEVTRMKAEFDAEPRWLFVMKDVSKKKQAKHNQETKAAKLQTFNDNKSEFLATASHEMRTPLTIMREFTNLLVDEVAGPVTAHQKQCLASVLRNCDRLTCLLDDLLDLAKIESGKMILNRSRLNLGLVLKACADDFTPLLQRKSQTITLEIEENLPNVLADRAKIEEALVNFIGNSNKFTQQGGQICLKAYTSGMYVQVEVTDNGRGIEESDLAGIFEAFAQVSSIDNSGSKGTGLGLTITRKIVALHDGVVSIRSIKGAGSTFGFTLPIYAEGIDLAGFVRDHCRKSSDRSRRAKGMAVLVTDLEGGVPDDSKMKMARDVCDSHLSPASRSDILRQRGILVYIDASPVNDGKSNIDSLRSALEHQGINLKVVQFEIYRDHVESALNSALNRLRYEVVATDYVAV